MKYNSSRHNNNVIKAAWIGGICVLAAAVIGGIFVLIAAKTEPDKPLTPLTDERKDRKDYKTISIANRIWMAENLTFKPDTGEFKCHDYNEANCKKYGRLYDWNTATNICPEYQDWHLPTNNEWDALAKAMGGKNVAGKKLRLGNRGFSPRLFKKFDSSEYKFACWWSATIDENEGGNSFAYAWCIGEKTEHISKNTYGKNRYFPVRCIKNPEN